MTIEIDGRVLNLKKAKFDLDKFDLDGRCNDYTGKEYVGIGRIYGKDKKRTEELNLEDIVIGKFERIFDERNTRNAFDPRIYSDYIQVVLEIKDDCNENYIDEIYEII